jgi:hypothetical protein
MLNQAQGDRQILAKQLGISPHQLSYVTHANSGEQLLRGFNEVNRLFYSLGSISQRLRNSPVGLYWTLPLNLVYHYLLRK